MKIFVCHTGDFDFVTKLYKPLQATSLATEHELFLPHEAGRNVKTKSIIESSDIVVAEVSMPSTGQGIELGWADAANVPIIALYEVGSDYSKSAGYIAKEMHQYTSVEDMILCIQAFIHSNTRHV